MTKSKLSKFYSFSFPVVSILLGLTAGVLAFLHQSPKDDQTLADRFLRPTCLGLTTTYIVMTIGTNLKIAKARSRKTSRLK